MEVGEPHAFLGEAVAVRGGCFATGMGEIAVAEIVGQQVYHVGVFAEGGQGVSQGEKKEERSHVEYPASEDGRVVTP